MKKKTKILLGVILSLLIVAAGAGIWWQSRTAAKSSTQQNFTVARVTRGNIAVSLTGTGTLEPLEQEQIFLKNSGTVKKVYVKQGDQVKKGDLLYELEDKELTIALQKAQLDLQQKQQDLEKTEKAMQQAEITAPSDGVIKAIDVEEGDTVGTTKAIATLVDLKHTQVQIPFTATQIKHIQVGQKAEVLLVDFISTHQGEVTKVERVGVPQSSGAVYYYATITMTGDYYAEGQERYAQVTVSTKQGPMQGIEAGLLLPHETTEIFPEISASIAKIHVAEGETVKKGQKLFTLDTSDLAMELDQKRTAVELAALEVEDLKQQVADLVVRSPIDGIVIEQNLQEGEEVTAGTADSAAKEPAAIIENRTQMQVTLPIDELDIGKIKIGLPATVQVEAAQGSDLQGTVTAIAETGVDQNNVSTFDVTVTIGNNTEAQLKTGMTADVTIHVAQKNDVLLLPLAAVQQRNGKSYVYLMPESNNAGGQAKSNGNAGFSRKLTEIVTGLSTEDRIEIVSGLQEGDQVIMPLSSGTNSQMRPGNMMMPGMFGGAPQRPQGTRGGNNR